MVLLEIASRTAECWLTDSQIVDPILASLTSPPVRTVYRRNKKFTLDTLLPALDSSGNSSQRKDTAAKLTGTKEMMFLDTNFFLQAMYYPNAY